MVTGPRYAILIVNIVIIDMAIDPIGIVIVKIVIIRMVMVIDPIVAVILATQQLWGRKLHIPPPPRGPGPY